MARFLTIGSSLQDIYLIDHDDFRPSSIGRENFYGQIAVGSKVEIDRIAYEVGGGAVNAATTLARHGHDVSIMSVLADDAAGAAIMAHLDRENIDNAYISFARGSTGCSVILLDSKSGERTVLTHRGVSATHNYDTALLAEIQPDWLYITTIGGQMPLLASICASAKKLGIKIMFNPGKKELAESRELLHLLPQIDILLLNRHEASSLVPGVTLQDLLPRLAAYCPTVIITDGSMGGIATDGNSSYRFGIYADIRIKDTTGAGDAFGSGFLAHLASGHSFRSSLIFASANSTAVVSRIGANRAALTGTESLHPMIIQKIPTEHA